MRSKEALVVRIFAGFTVWVWGTRIFNILKDSSTSTGFKVVHSVLAAISVGLAIAAWRVVHTARQRARAAEIDLTVEQQTSSTPVAR